MIFCFVHAKQLSDGVMTKKVWLAAATALIAGLVAAGAAYGHVYEQKYIVEAVITPLNEEHHIITSAEVWKTVVYRDPIRLHTVVRVFGEALHFVYEGKDYFLLKRGAHSTSAGAFDLLRDCLGINVTADYSRAEALGQCTVKSYLPMIVRANDSGELERLEPGRIAGLYPDFIIDLRVRPTRLSPGYELEQSFPWISELPVSLPSSRPFTIPEEGGFAGNRHYQKDFVVRE